ncbi:MAG: hypothetical protein ACI9EF_003489 [Pseudohongiellaceae bacterium]|jgi:hypothetical protein
MSTITSTLNTVKLTLAALALAPCLTAQSIQVEGDVIRLGGPVDAAPSERARPAPDHFGGSGTPAPSFLGGDTFGADVDIEGVRMIVADATNAYIYNLALGGFESVDVLGSLTGLGTPVEVANVDIHGTSAWVTWEREIADRHLFWRFDWDGSAWLLATGYSTFDSDPGTRLETAVHEGSTFALIYTIPGFYPRVQVGDAGGGGGVMNLIGVSSEPAEDAAIEVAIGDGPTPSDPLSVVATFETAGTRTVIGYTYDGVTLTKQGTIATGSAADDFGGALAVDEGWIWIGSPDSDVGNTNGGLIELYEDGTYTFGGSLASGQAEDRFGRSLAIDGDVTVVGEQEADLLPGSSKEGAVRVLRKNAAGTLWTLTGEIYHTVNSDFATFTDFGHAVALDGKVLAATGPGTPAEVGSFWYRDVPFESVFDNDIVPGLAGFGGLVPSAREFGDSTYPSNNLPFLLEISNARPSSTAFLVASLTNLSAPFKGGTLLPLPDLIIPLPIDGAGELFLPLTWNSGVPGPFTIYNQVWFPDVDGPSGFSASQGWSVTQPF